MNAKLLIAVASLAAATSGFAHADDGNATQYGIYLTQGTRTRAEVMVEASKVSATRSFEPAGSRVIAAPVSKLDAKEVRASAAQAVRLGQISAGEVGRL